MAAVAFKWGAASPAPSAREVACSAIFAAQFVALDLAFRGAGAYVAAPKRLFAALASVAIWSLACRAARAHRAARVAVAIVAGVLVAVDAVAWRYYGAPLDRHFVRAAIQGWPDVRLVLLAGLGRGLAMIAAAVAVELALLAGATARSFVRWPWGIGLAIGVVGAPLDDATPDLRALVAVGALRPTSEARAGVEGAARSVDVTSPKPQLPNVLFVLTESVRASSYGASPGSAEAHARNPEIDALLPDRVALDSMHAVASYTALSLDAIASGEPPAAAKGAPGPDLFARVRSVRTVAGARPFVAYWASHAAHVWSPRDVASEVDSFTSLEDLLGGAVDDEEEALVRDVDGLLADRVAPRIASLRAPYFAFLHLAGTHAPYFVDDARAPFRPYSHVVAWSGLDDLRRAYEDAVVAQDARLARVVRAFLDAQRGAPWVVVFTSDHGEAFGEHGAIHHGQNLYEEQIHVPAWIAWGNGALRPDEERLLRDRSRVPATHLDLLPTVLDLYGVLDADGTDRARLAGASLLRAPPAIAPPVPITNCTPSFECPIATWGLLAGDLALEAQAWDGAWRCVALGAATREIDRSEPACGALERASREAFATQPNGAPNR
jgi:hypothetical protein